VALNARAGGALNAIALSTAKPTTPHLRPATAARLLLNTITPSDRSCPVCSTADLCSQHPPRDDRCQGPRKGRGFLCEAPVAPRAPANRGGRRLPPNWARPARASSFSTRVRAADVHSASTAGMAPLDVPPRTRSDTTEERGAARRAYASCRP
jgi:hypothetical protein